MKTRATSFALAALAVVSLTLPAFAAVSDELPEETPAKIEDIEAAEKLKTPALLDGEPVESVEFEILDGVCYVTVSSFVSMMDAEAMVEEEDGIVSVNSSAVIEVVALDGQPQQAGPEEAVPEEGVPAAEGEQAAEEAQAGLAGDLAADVVTDDLALTAAAGGDYVVANGRYLYAGDGVIQMDGRVAAPVRLLARVFNLDVSYDAQDSLVLLTSREGAEPYLADAGAVYDADVLYWLSRIIHAESGNQPLEGKIAVGNVVMNRVNHPRFPNNIYDVLFQKNQFSPAASGSIYRDPNAESEIAAMLVLDGAQVTPDALFFNAAGARSYASRTRTYVATIGDHMFYK